MSSIDSKQYRFPFPFPPYAVQDEFRTVLLSNLREGTNPVVALELPTGCGKTLSVLSAALSFQQAFTKKGTAAEQEKDLDLRQRARESLYPEIYSSPSTPLASAASIDGAEKESSETEEELQQRFIQCFTNQNSALGKKRRRRGLGETNDRSSLLAAEHDSPSMTVMYACRTHSQVRQAALELRRFKSSSSSLTYSSGEHSKSNNSKKEDATSPTAPTPASLLKMNIMASREKYCVHPSVERHLSRAGGTAERSGTNDLGELCDKIVAMGQCPHVESFDRLGHRSLCGRLPAVDSNGCSEGDNIWAIEDLVRTGKAEKGCPYYAARDMVFYADITFLTYNYLLDPIIRSETKYERALANSIIIFDEAHNVSDVCQDVLSGCFTMESLERVQGELIQLTAQPQHFSGGGSSEDDLPPELRTSSESTTTAASNTAATVMSTGNTTDTAGNRQHGPGVFVHRSSAVRQNANGGAGAQSPFSPLLQYPRQFRTTRFTLSQLFDFAYVLVTELLKFLRSNDPSANSPSTNAFQENVKCVSGLATGIVNAVVDNCAHCHDVESFAAILKDFTALISTLGVTFNPFDLSVFVVGELKRLTLLLKFYLSFQSCFSTWFESPPAAATNNDQCGNGGSSSVVLKLRCLDPRLAFHHLIRKCYCCVLMSGTLAPFDDLSSRLGFTTVSSPVRRQFFYTPTAKRKGKKKEAKKNTVGRAGGNSRSDELTAEGGGGRLVEVGVYPNVFSGSHVIDIHRQCHVGVLTHQGRQELRCVHNNYNNDDFMSALAQAIWRLCTETHCCGGALVFAPNYSVAERLTGLLKRKSLPRTSSSSAGFGRDHTDVPCLLEPRSSSEFAERLEWFKSKCIESNGRCSDGSVAAAAIFIGVHRGKLAEGIDLTDEMARLVISVGVPYRPLKEQSIIAQRQYSGEAWYTVDALRAVNQSLGRCIRHVEDFGAMFLLDSRFAMSAQQQPGDEATAATRRGGGGRSRKKSGHDLNTTGTTAHNTQTSLGGMLSKWLQEGLTTHRSIDEAIESTASVLRDNQLSFSSTRRHVLPSPGTTTMGFTAAASSVTKHVHTVMGRRLTAEVDYETLQNCRSTGLVAGNSELRFSLYSGQTPAAAVAPDQNDTNRQAFCLKAETPPIEAEDEEGKEEGKVVSKTKPPAGTFGSVAVQKAVAGEGAVPLPSSKFGLEPKTVSLFARAEVPLTTAGSAAGIFKPAVDPTALDGLGPAAPAAITTRNVENPFLMAMDSRVAHPTGAGCVDEEAECVLIVDDDSSSSLASSEDEDEGNSVIVLSA